MLDSTIVYSTFEQLNRYESRLAGGQVLRFERKSVPLKPLIKFPRYPVPNATRCKIKFVEKRLYTKNETKLCELSSFGR